VAPKFRGTPFHILAEARVNFFHVFDHKFNSLVSIQSPQP
jgi:hypothetical protein